MSRTVEVPFSQLVQQPRETDDAGTRALLFALPEVFPWVRFLRSEDVRGFLVELVETTHACAAFGNLAALEPVVAAWRATAEIHSDPRLLRAATIPIGQR